MPSSPHPPLDAKLQDGICGVISLGCQLPTAADYMHCWPEDVRDLADTDAAFHQALRHAEAQFEVIHMTNIYNAAKDIKNWRVSTWALERRFPDRYGPRRPDMVTVEQMTRAMKQLAKVVVEELPVRKYRERILARVGELTESLRQSARAEVDDHAA